MECFVKTMDTDKNECLPPPPKDDDSEKRLWIGNLDNCIREYQLLKIVEKFGELTEFDFLYHRSGPLSGKPRGYAFVTFTSFESAQKCQKELDGQIVDKKKLMVKWAHAQTQEVEKKYKRLPLALGNVCTKKTKVSTEKKIASIEAQLKMLESMPSNVTVNPDVGKSSTKRVRSHVMKRQDTAKRK